MEMAWQRPLAADESRHHFLTGPVSCLLNSYGPPVYCQPMFQFQPTFQPQLMFQPRSTFQPQPINYAAVSIKEEPVPYISQYHSTSCSSIPSSGATSIQARQAPPKTKNDAQTPIYVNSKQFRRILKRRESR
jgi:hypothetical protein